jgi:hypothetical protein
MKCGVRAFNGELIPVEYPCDVTIVLNALELETYDMTDAQSSNENCVEMHEVRANNVENVVSVDDEGNVVEPNYTELGINMPEAEGCDHIVAFIAGECMHYAASDVAKWEPDELEAIKNVQWFFNYCPDCGEKL